MESLLNLKNLSNTRWLARSELIRVVCISFEVIQSTLVDISTSNSFDAKNKNASHQSHMETYINRLWYKFDVSEERHAPYAADDRNPSITWVKHHRCYRHHTEHGWVAEKKRLSWYNESRDQSWRIPAEASDEKSTNSIRPESRNHRKGNTSSVLSRRAYKAAEHADIGVC